MVFSWNDVSLRLFAVETNTWGTALQQLRDHFDWELWGGLLTTLAAVWWISAIYLRKRGQKIRKIDNPKRLFRELVRAHRLSWAETALIEQLAEARELEDPSLMFVRDDYWTVHDLEGEVVEKAAAVEKLHAKLFARAELPNDERGTRNAEQESTAETAEPTSTV